MVHATLHLALIANILQIEPLNVSLKALGQSAAIASMQMGSTNACKVGKPWDN